MKYLLDSNFVIALLKDHPESWRRLDEHPIADVVVSSIVVHELYFGAFKSRSDRNLRVIERLRFAVLAFDENDALIAGRIRADLAAAGTPIGPYDTLIAGQALARSLTLVTRNTREFRRVEGLLVEDWETLPS